MCRLLIWGPLIWYVFLLKKKIKNWEYGKRITRWGIELSPIKSKFSSQLTDLLRCLLIYYGHHQLTKVFFI